MEVIAIDWSGAVTGSATRIWLAHVIDGELVALRNGRGRQEVVDELVALRPRTPGGLVDIPRCVLCEETLLQLNAQGDTVYVPQNTIAQHFGADGQPLRLLSGQNRLFRQLGYDRVVYLENAPQYDGVAEAVRA